MTKYSQVFIIMFIPDFTLLVTRTC